MQYEITEELGVLSESKSGWRKEVNRVSWNGAVPKLDIRDWAPDHEKMGKKHHFLAEEAERLKDILNLNNTDAAIHFLNELEKVYNRLNEVLI